MKSRLKGRGMTKEEKCPYCNGKNKVEFFEEIGWDSYKHGEECNHLEKCGCGAYRYIIDDYKFKDNMKRVFDKRYYGQWQHNNSCPK